LGVLDEGLTVVGAGHRAAVCFFAGFDSGFPGDGEELFPGDDGTSSVEATLRSVGPPAFVIFGILEPSS
jgi:hypothetical protein